MSKTMTGTHIYTVVDVVQGVADGAYCFLSSDEAFSCARRLSEGRDLQEDDVQVFEAVIGASCEPVVLDLDSSGE